MSINKLNYENYIIDYIEGSLSSDLKSEFDVFIKLHPEIHIEIKNYLAAPILAEDKEIIFEHKEDLVKTNAGSSRQKFGAVLFALLLIAFFGFYHWNSMTQKQFSQLSSMMPTSIEKTTAIETNSLQKAKTKSTLNQKKEQLNESDNISESENKKEENGNAKESTINKIDLNKVEKMNDRKNEEDRVIQPKQVEDNSIEEASKKPAIIQYATETIENSVPKTHMVSNEVNNESKNNEFQETNTVTLSQLDEVVMISSLTNESLRPSKKPRRTVVLHMASVTPAEYESDNKSKILDLFIPQSYKDIELKKSVVTTNSSGNKNKILKAFAPKSISK